MPRKDAVRWNDRYQNSHSRDFQTPRSFLVEHIDILPPHGMALDLAMGAGKNVSALLSHGLDVVGIDISSTAVFQARQHYPGLKAIIADLTQFCLPARTFDVVLNFYYLQRDLWGEFGRVLKPGGLLVFETLTKPMLSVRPDLTPAFLLEEGELQRAFQDWEILVYREGWITGDRGYKKSVASVIARLPEVSNGYSPKSDRNGPAA